MKEYIQTKLFEDRIVEDWDFVKDDTQYATHGLHPYPARMIPQVARRLIKRYLLDYLPPPHSRYVILDPFCGSGTVLLEAKLLGVNAIGIDVNPLAILIAKAKVNPPDPKSIIEIFDDLLQAIKSEKNAEKPRFNNINYWFKPNVIRDLSKIKKTIERLDDIRILNFFRICLSLTARKSSNIYREGDTYIKRMNDEQLKKHNPNVFEIFSEIVTEKLKNIIEFYSICKISNVFSEVMLSNALTLCIRPNSIDLIVTSPPYGEEKNTVSYTRWSKISLYWLMKDFDSMKKFEKLMLGARKSANIPPSQTLKEIIKDVEKENKNLALDAVSFFNDYYEALKSMFNVLKDNRYCCVVIGNRSIRQRRIPMDKVTIELAESVGFKHEQTFYRTLPRKALPWKCGKGETISKENIVILKKE